MIRDFSKDELEAAASSRDTELTLGGMTLLVLCCGLLALCAVCFSIGYFVGHRTSQESTATSSSASDPKPFQHPTGSGNKPGAAGQAPARPQQAADVDAGGSSSQVKPAVDTQEHPAQAAQSGVQSASQFQGLPGTAQVQGWMVQIAAVSHTEDAQVLVDALRKRGYAVTARREAGDNLIHVQTGPFVNRNDANGMRQRLLNDGYNAIVE
jgi:cell division septation protein DedD